MTLHIDHNDGMIVMGDHIERQENHIDRNVSFIANASFCAKPQTTVATEQPAAKPLTLTAVQQALFDRAETAGLLRRTANGYRWLHQSATLRDYFLGRVFCGDYPSVKSGGKVLWYYGNDNVRLPVKQLSQLFGCKVGDNRRQRQNEQVPEGHEMVDGLFTI